jgi:ferredoxin-fold anticodon binding domain-containing protein
MKQYTIGQAVTLHSIYAGHALSGTVTKVQRNAVFVQFSYFNQPIKFNYRPSIDRFEAFHAGYRL